jgi:hypothetical protein
VKRPFGNRGSKWDDNIKTDLEESGYEDMGCIHLAQDRVRWWAVVNTAIKIWVP